MNNVDTDIYWLAMSPGPKTDEKLLLLKENRYKVIRSDSKAEFQEAFAVSPSENTIIIISEEIYSPITSNTIQQLFQDPAYDGARLIYCYGNFENNSSVKAIECGAKDIIPLGTTNLRWLNKFRFSAGSQSSRFPGVDYGVALKEKANLELPSRIVWLNKDFICVNTNFCPEVGDNVLIHNKHHNQIDLESYNFKVAKTHSNYLTYRYSNAIICEWTGKDALAEEEKKRYIARLKDTCHPLRQNIYLGIYSKKIRRRLINKFDKNKFHVHCSSNILRMLDEIKYLQPEIILLDGRAFSKAKTLIPKIRSTAGKQVHIYIFGLKLSKELKEKLNKKYNIHCYEKIPLLIEKSINKKAVKHDSNSAVVKYELDAEIGRAHI